MNAKPLALLSLLLVPACAPEDAAQTDEVVDHQQGIVGGTPEKIQDAPWQVSLFLEEFGHGCGGSIIDEQHVITARHCVERPGAEGALPDLLSPKAFKIAAGFSKQSERDAKAQILEVDEVIPLAPYDGIAENGGDIVLLRTVKKFKFNSKVQPIALATRADELAGLIAPGKMATVTGWGQTTPFEDPNAPLPDELQTVQLPIRTVEEAEAVGGKPIADDFVAAGGEAGKDSCFGDSGGPLVVKKGGKYILAGVVSFGPLDTVPGSVACGSPGVPALYSRVAFYTDAIEQALCEEKRVIKKKDGLAGTTGKLENFIEVHVPAGQRFVNFTVFGGTGDADLKVRRGARPTDDVFDCRTGFIGATAETCSFDNPEPGVYWVALQGFEDYAGAKLRVNGYVMPW